jgi:hypothetical protein
MKEQWSWKYCSGKYFIDIQDEIKSNNIYNLSEWGLGQPGRDFWKPQRSMASWERTNISVVCSDYNAPTLSKSAKHVCNVQELDTLQTCYPLCLMMKCIITPPPAIHHLRMLWSVCGLNPGNRHQVQLQL